jgi:cbb3-type cytochrome oxidase subunit 1
MRTLAVHSLRVALVLLLLVSVLVQILLPGWASAFGRRNPEVEHLVVPYALAAILFIGCIQVALLAVWRLLSMVRGEAIFTGRAVRWVDVIIGCASVAIALTTGVLVHMLGFIPGGAGPTVFSMAATVLGGLAFVMLMVVMRGLLVSAVADRTELDEVI